MLRAECANEKGGLSTYLRTFDASTFSTEGQAPRYLIRDQDGIYGTTVRRRLRAMGIRDKPIAPGVATAEWICGEIDRHDRSNIIAVESKCTEYFSRPKNTFSDAYFDEICEQDPRRSGTWFAEMVRLSQAPKYYVALHAAQLIKHAIGLAHRFNGRPVELYYLYWEPTNADEIGLCLEHRKEIADFVLRVEGGNPAFKPLSYDQLWIDWERLDEPRWLKEHVALLRKRYGVAIETR